MTSSLCLGERPVTPARSRRLAEPPRSSHDHTVQFYETDAALLGELERFVGAALAAGDAAVVIATETHRTALAERLHARGFDIAHLRTLGRYVPLDAAATLAAFAPAGRPDAERFFNLIGDILARATAAAVGMQPRVAVFGELVALLCARGNYEAAIEVEEFGNDLTRAHRVSILCGYPLDCFASAADGEPMRRICEAHSGVVPGESYTALPDDDRRLRTIALLQQKARALEAEVEARKRAQRSLQLQEDALRERNRELREALAARDEFLSVAAHELKTPITSLRTFAQLLLRDARRGQGIAPERLERALTAIEEQTGKLDQLLARLLDTTQIEAGRLRIERVPTDLVSLVRAVVDRQTVSTEHRLVFEAPAYLDVVVDPVRFEQVVTNLLDNAVKFSPEGGTVMVELGREEGGGVRLAVTDHGVGIPPDQRDAVFDRLYQAHGDRHLSGMGLGLYVTREIVGSHGGEVRIEEPEHPGSRFAVVLPSSASASAVEPFG
jgi:signal transduction histidine kinase